MQRRKKFTFCQLIHQLISLIEMLTISLFLEGIINFLIELISIKMKIEKKVVIYHFVFFIYNMSLSS